MNTDKKICKGDLTAMPGVVYDYTEITCSLYASGADTKTAFPKLATVGGSLDASGADTKTAFPKLATVGGYLDARGADTKTAFPKLATVGGYLDASGADTKTAFPKLATVGGSLYAKGADTKTAFPKLATVGGYLDASGAYSHVKTNDKETADAGLALPGIIARKSASLVLSSFAAAGFSFADGILARIISQRGPVSRVIVLGKTEVSYVLSDAEGNHAHGDTLDETRKDLMVKRTSQDLTQFKAWTLEKVVSKSDAIMAYRSITGACSKGTRLFLEQRQTPEKITVKGIIDLTKGAYGSQVFEKFFQKEKS